MGCVGSENYQGLKSKSIKKCLEGMIYEIKFGCDKNGGDILTNKINGIPLQRADQNAGNIVFSAVSVGFFDQDVAGRLD